MDTMAVTMQKRQDDRDNFKVLVNPPDEMAAGYAQWYKNLRSNEGITWGIPSVDKHVIPMRPGDLVGLVGRPGHGKSSLMAYLARAEAKRIQARGAVGKEVVVYVTWESSAEEIETFFMSDGEFSATDIAWGRVPYETVMAKLLKRPQFPVWVIGHAIAKAGQPTPRMTLPAVLECVEYMQRDYGVKPVLALFDYLQLIPVARAADRVAQVLEAPPLIKELAQRIGTPAVCGVQAARDVDDRKVKIPQKRDCQWGSSIEQAADKLFGLWRPYLTEPHDAPPIEIVPGQFAEIKPELLIMQMLKQRMDEGRYTWGLHFAPQYLRISELGGIL
jgi:replicative DNA helicase